MSRHLNHKQILTLKVILTFRYVTTDNLATYRNITHNSAYSALQILHAAGYLGKIHEKSFRLLNKSARYFLTQQSLDYLQKEASLELDNAILKSRRSDAKKSSEFIDLQVAIHAAYNDLLAKLPEGSKIMTSLDVYGVEGIVKPLPGLFVQPKKSKYFFVELADGQHLFLAKKRIRKYIENYDSNEWEWETYPDVCIVRSSASDRTRLRKYAEGQMEDNYLDADDLSFNIVGSISAIKFVRAV